VSALATLLESAADNTNTGAVTIRHDGAADACG